MAKMMKQDINGKWTTAFCPYTNNACQSSCVMCTKTYSTNGSTIIICTKSGFDGDNYTRLKCAE